MATAPPPADRRWVVAGLGLVALLELLAGCSSSSGSAGSSGSSAAPGTRLRVVAAENTWGSIAAQLGGDHAEVVSLITNPDTDPHDYEPTPADARTVAEAQEVIVNGLGYDTWASRLVAADQVEGQHQLDVGHLLGLRTGANPHRWYYPDDVVLVVDQITADYQRLDPADGGEFAARR